MTVNPKNIKNKVKRMELIGKLRLEKKKEKKERKDRLKEAAARGEIVPEKQLPVTLDDKRVKDETIVTENDVEIEADELGDEFSRFFANEEVPKIMITTSPRPCSKTYLFIKDLMQLLPNSFYYDRKNAKVKDICTWGSNKKFTHIVVLTENSKLCTNMVLSVLPAGPTAHFKLSSIVLSKDIYNGATTSHHIPELILNNFTTRIGHRIGRLLGSMYPHKPEFVGRKVITFHNQRDYVFVRQHRYAFEGGDISGKMVPDYGSNNSDKKGKRKKGKSKQTLVRVKTMTGNRQASTRTRIQEIGPRFTLKLKWMQEGLFDMEFGEYEWFYKPGVHNVSRKKFIL